MTPLYIVIGIVLILTFIVIGMYNGLVTLRQQVKNAWADIDVQLKRRYDLIPNLIETVKGSASFESSTLEKVITARNAAMSATGANKEHAEAENALSGTLKSLFALSENYPDLKSNQNYLELQRELSDTEDKIQAARRFYNTTVTAYNTKIETVPSNIIASKFSFKPADLFELAESESAARDAVKVSF